MEKEYEIIKFEDGDFSLDVNVSKDDYTVWLSAMDMSLLFEKNYKSISRIINNIFVERGLDKDSNSQKMRFTGNDKPTTYYDLKIIVLVGDFINSKRTEKFKEWVDNLLNDKNNKITLVEPIIQFNDDGVCLDVTVSPEKDTVWLTQAQMSELFDTTKQNISAHIQNIYDIKELDEVSTVNYFLTVQKEGNREITRSIKAYNLDMIISVGFRVNSKRGIIFRQWANKALKNLLVNGFAIDEKRCLACASNVNYLMNITREISEKTNNRLDIIENLLYQNNNKLLFEGEILDAYSFIMKLFFLATNKLIIIDNYADEFLLNMLKNITVLVTIYTNSYINESRQDNIKIINTNVFHDRYIIVDDLVYSIGTSVNSIGKKRFTIHKLEDISVEYLLKNIK